MAEALPTDTECSPMIAATDQPSSQSAKWDVGGRVSVGGVSVGEG